MVRGVLSGLAQRRPRPGRAPPSAGTFVADVSVTVGRVKLPPMVTTAEPGAPTVYCEGFGESDTTMYVVGLDRARLLEVVRVTVAVVAPAASVTTGSGTM